MEDVELKEVLGSFKDAIDIILSRLDRYDEMYHAQDERIDELERVFYDDILNPAKKALDEHIYEDEYSKFHDQYGERLDPYNEQLRAIEGDDFDLSRKAFDDYNAYEEKPDMEEYVNLLVDSVGKQLEEIKEKLGIEGEVKATVDEDGEVKLEVEEEKTSEPKAETVDEKKKEAIEDGHKPEIVEESIFDVDSDPTEIEKFEKELEEYKD